MNTMGHVGDEAGDVFGSPAHIARDEEDEPWIKRQPEQVTMMDCASAVVVFKVDYEQARRLPTGTAVHSDAIPAGGHMWRINFYPFGMRATTDISRPYDRHCIALELLTSFDKVGSASGVAAVFDVMVLDDEGQPALNSVRRTGRMKNNFYGTFAWLFGPDGVPAEEFVEKYVTRSGYVEFRCTIRVLDDSPPIPVPPPGIAAHLGALLDTADGADVSFTVAGETFPAHRAVVAARSPVLREEIERCCSSIDADDAATSPTTMPSIVLHDIAPATFKDVLRFIYTDTLPRGDEGHDDEDAGGSWMLRFIDTDTLARGDNDGHDDAGDLAGGSSSTKMLECLLAAADRYALDRLKLLCAQKLWDDVSADTVATTLACAQMYNCPELKEKCIKFFAKEKNFKKAVLTEGFVELVQQFPSIIIELRDNVGT